MTKESGGQQARGMSKLPTDILPTACHPAPSLRYALCSMRYALCSMFYASYRCTTSVRCRTASPLAICI